MNDENPTGQPAPPPEPTNELAAAHKRIDELARAYQAAEQDRSEFKQRLQRERERMLDVEKADVALALIEVIDDLDLCLEVPEDSPLYQGVRLIRDKVVSRLEAKQIERLDLLGKKYDPRVAEAVDLEVTTEPDEDGTIIAVLRAGYQMKGRVIRPARVKVARFVEPAHA